MPAPPQTVTRSGWCWAGVVGGYNVGVNHLVTHLETDYIGNTLYTPCVYTDFGLVAGTKVKNIKIDIWLSVLIFCLLISADKISIC